MIWYFPLQIRSIMHKIFSLLLSVSNVQYLKSIQTRDIDIKNMPPTIDNGLYCIPITFWNIVEFKRCCEIVVKQFLTIQRNATTTSWSSCYIETFVWCFLVIRFMIPCFTSEKIEWDMVRKKTEILTKNCSKASHRSIIFEKFFEHSI